MLLLEITCVFFTCSAARLISAFTLFPDDCPGSDKDAKIAPETLRYLRFYVLGEGNFLTSSKTEYNYYQMKELARNTDFRQTIVLYMAGYLDSPNFITPSLMGTVYKRTGNYTVWLLDYNRFSTFAYPIAARFLRPVGKHVAEMLARLTTYGLNINKFELVGLSHGGQGISFIAKNYKRITGQSIAKIVALDPGSPCFRHLSPAERLNKSDAKFVLVVHTNIDGFGMAEPSGHVDFYVNGGEFQPGDIPSIPCISLCSHAKSYLIWTAALQYPKSFIGIQCDSVQDARMKNCYDRVPRVTNILGQKTDPNKPGIFYLNTFHNYPYVMGKEGLKKEKEIYNWQISEYNEPDLVIE